MSVILRTVAASDRGKARDNNEDSVYAGQRVVAVADGVGGGPSGEVASDIVVRTMAALEAEPITDGPTALRDAVLAANQRIRKAIDGDPSLQGMATTLTAMLAVADELSMVHIGDSRAYAWRNHAFAQLTKDDTYVQGLVDSGVILAAEARHHPQRFLVTQAINGSDIRPAFFRVDAQPGDRYLLCSDGLSDVVDDQTIAQTLGEYGDLPQCAQRLINLALDAGAPDNVSVVLAEVLPPPPAG